jgi:hypothetical protein
MCYDPAVKAWHALAAALLFWIPPGAGCAEDSTAAARELARKTAAFTAHAEAVSIAWRNLSSLDASAFAQIRSVFEAAFQESGGRLAPASASAVRITLSENPSAYLLVEEAQAGDERRVWIASWNRGGPPKLALPGITIEKKLLWEQDAAILDVALFANSMLVLSPDGVTLYDRVSGVWQLRQSAAISPPRPWPRDLRGRLRVNGASFQALLPGLACAGAASSTLTLDCRASDEPWVLESGARFLLLANYAATRNYFDGRIVTQSGAPKTVPPFYSAAAAAEQGRPLWLLATLDGAAQIFDASFAPIGSISNWGSDFAGVDVPCAAGPQILATRPGDASSGDAVQAFAMVARAAAPVSPPAVFSGPVTALWPAGGSSAVAIVRDNSKYAAYLLTVTCGS